MEKWIDQLIFHDKTPKIIYLYGGCNTGKTTAIHQIQERMQTLLLQGDELVWCIM